MKNSTNEKIAKALAKKQALENEIKTLKNQQKAEAERERKQRQSKWGNIIEKLLPHLETLSEHDFEIYMKKVLLPPETQDIISTKEVVENDEE